MLVWIAGKEQAPICKHASLMLGMVFVWRHFSLCLHSHRVPMEINSFNPGSSHSHRKNRVSKARFSAIILGLCSSEHDERRLTLALVYMVIGLEQ
jgi:hypothetical protein